MDNTTKNQVTGVRELKMRELTQKELVAIDGGVTYEWVMIEGKRVLIIRND